MKRCSECGKSFPATLEYFHRDKRLKSGLKASCKLCSNTRVSTFRAEHPDRIHESTKRSNIKNRDKILQRAKDYARKNADIRRQQNRKFEQENPNKRAAMVAVRRAIERGDLQRAATFKCSCGGVNCSGKAREYHHHKGYDPANWLDVIPVCATCHRFLDRNK